MTRASRHVLVAEDNATNQLLVRELLRRAGHCPEIVENGTEAVRAYSEGDYDIILMDCQMPEMDGFEATRRIRELQTKRRERPTPIVALTANAIEGDEQRCLDAGMDAYISKPVDSGKLLATIDRLCHADESMDPALGKQPTGMTKPEQRRKAG